MCTLNCSVRGNETNRNILLPSMMCLLIQIVVCLHSVPTDSSLGGAITWPRLFPLSTSFLDFEAKDLIQYPLRPIGSLKWEQDAIPKVESSDMEKMLETLHNDNSCQSKCVSDLSQNNDRTETQTST